MHFLKNTALKASDSQSVTMRRDLGRQLLVADEFCQPSRIFFKTSQMPNRARSDERYRPKHRDKTSGHHDPTSRTEPGEQHESTVGGRTLVAIYRNLLVLIYDLQVTGDPIRRPTTFLGVMLGGYDIDIEFFFLFFTPLEISVSFSPSTDLTFAKI